MKMRITVLLLCALLSGCSARQDTIGTSADPSASISRSSVQSAAKTGEESSQSAEEKAEPGQRQKSEEGDLQLSLQPDSLPSRQVQPVLESAPEGDDAFSVGAIPEEVKARMQGVSYTEDSPVGWGDLSYVTVIYLDFDGAAHTGYMVVHNQLAQDVADIFKELYQARYPIAKISLIDEYGGDDNLSMADNNTYSYCTRPIADSENLSLHSYGICVDINPIQNPYILAGEAVLEESKEYLDRTDVRDGMITEGDVCYNAFASRGWFWGGYWASPDYQHFQKHLN